MKDHPTCRYLVLLATMHLLLTVAAARVTNEQLKTIFLRLYVGSTVEEYVDQPLDTAEQMVAKMENNKPTVFYIHGYTESLNSESVNTVMTAYLKRKDHNVVAVDYSVISNERYTTLAASAVDVGTALAMAINEMVQAGLDPQKIHLVGHSMGAQVAGHTGRRTSFEIPRITGLDPAGPFFNFLEAYLSAGDARFVDIIHTDYGIYGIARTTGTVDFFPNGGRRLQPGCPQNATFFSSEDFCSHRRSWAFYAESVIAETSFLAQKCSSYKQFLRDECKDNEKVHMGFGVPKTAKGSFYLITRSESPYGLKEQGVRYRLSSGSSSTSASTTATFPAATSTTSMNDA